MRDPFPAPLADRDEATWDEVHTLNLRGTWLCLRAQLRAMVAGGHGGAIVLNTGVGALVGGFGDGTQQAAKHSIASLVKAATADYAAHGIRTNAIAPGVSRHTPPRRNSPPEAASPTPTPGRPAGPVRGARRISKAAAFFLRDAPPTSPV